MTTAIVIPFDKEKPLTKLTFEPGQDAADKLHDAVGGYLQIINLERPDCGVYLNEEGHLNDLPLNPRGTAICWAHQSALRGRDLIVGDVVLVGPPDSEGNDMDAPDELVDLLLGKGPFKVEVQVHGETGWHGNDKTFDDVHVAYVAGVDLAQRWTKVSEVRVVKDASKLIGQWYEIGRNNPWIRCADDPPFTVNSFAQCFTLDELEDRIGHGNWSLGTAFYYWNLCFINQVEGGDEWLTIKTFDPASEEPTTIAFESFTFAPFIERGEFKAIIRRLLAASMTQCQQLKY